MKLTAKELILTSLFTALMAAGAFIRIPFPLLPITLQALFCALAGMILGARLGALSMVIYAVLGLAGIPIFTQGGGLAYVFNSSFGFILGFIPGAYIIGKVAGNPGGLSRKNSIKAAFTGLMVIYIIGTAYMFLIIRYYTGNMDASIIYVLTSISPYLLKDTVLSLAAALALPSIIPALSGTV